MFWFTGGIAKKKEKFRLVHPRHLWYHYEANLAKSFKLGFSLNEVSQLGISTLKSPLHGIAKAKDWWFQFHSLTFHIRLSFTTESKTPIVLPVSCDQSDLVGSKLIYEKDYQWPDIRNIAKMLGAKRCCWRVSLNRVRAKTEDRESPSQRYAQRLKRE